MSDGDVPVQIRSFRPGDQGACTRLYHDGLIGGELAGMIGVQHHEEGSGEIRRLRVAEGFRRRGIGSALVETAVRFCEERNYLKVTLDTFMEREPAVHLFEKFRFRHFRTRNVAGKDLMYFMLDLYAGDHHQQG